jgi:hypothetical protein
MLGLFKAEQNQVNILEDDLSSHFKMMGASDLHSSFPPIVNGVCWHFSSFDVIRFFFARFSIDHNLSLR